MKTKVFFLLVSALLIVSCEKTKYENTGTITGQDFALCACCGGYFIQIDDVNYRFEKSELPDNFTFDDNQLPLTVELDWEPRSAYCSDFNWINIQKIRKK